MAEGRLVIEGRANWAYTVWLTGQAKFDLGRGTMCDIQLDDEACSKQNSQIIFQDGRYQLCDLDSRNGTFVNGVKLEQPHTLRHGDVIRLGQSTMSFLDDTASMATGRIDFSQPVSGEEPETESRLALGPLYETIVRLSDSVSVATSKPWDEAGAEDWDKLCIDLVNLQEQVNTLAWQNQLLRRMSNDQPYNQRLEQTLHYLAAETKAENGFVMFVNPQTKKWEVRASFGKIADWKSGEAGARPLSLTVVKKTLDQGETVFSHMLNKDARFDGSKSIVALEIKASICAPVKDEAGKVAGVVYLDRRMSLEPFEDGDRGLCEVLAQILG